MSDLPRAFSLTIEPGRDGTARVNVWHIMWHGARRDLTKLKSAYLHDVPADLIDWPVDQALVWLLPALAAAHAAYGLTAEPRV